MMTLYSCALAVVLGLSSPVWLWRMARQGRYREGLRGRLGAVPERLVHAVRGRPVIWLHAVSVGEVMAAARLVEELEKALPQYAVVISTTTPTGQRVARERFGVDRVFYFPLDFAFAVRPYLRALQPQLLVLMESELWPRMLMECAGAKIPVAVVNARVSDRSLPRYRALRFLWRPLLRQVPLLLAQSEDDAKRWISIGAPANRVHSTGNVKFDLAPAEASSLPSLIRTHIPAEASVIVCGSTHDGEERPLLACDAVLLNAVTILAPRHPQRAADVLQACRDMNFRAELLSEWRLRPASLCEGSVLIVDTVGELAGLYALATVAIVGGSFLAHGGHNPLEPARFGVPILVGPHTENFRAVMQTLRGAEAIEVTSADGLCGALQAALADPATAQAMGRRAEAVFLREAGATERTVHALLPLMHERGAS